MAKASLEQNGEEQQIDVDVIDEEHVNEEDFFQHSPNENPGNGTSQAKNSKDQSGMHRPDPINDEPVDYIDVVATDSPTKMTLNEKNVIRVISAAPPSGLVTVDDEDDDESRILERLRKSREPPPKMVRRILVRRDPKTGSLLVDKNNITPNTTIQSLSGEDQKDVSPIKSKTAVTISELPTVTDDECDRAAEATKDFTSKLRSLKLTPKQKDAILLHAGSLVDKLITITKESKDREIQQKMEDDRLWLRNEIDSIIEKRLGAVRVNANRQFWRNEAEKFTEMALTNLMVYRENGTRKQDVLTSALAGFNMAYIQTHKYGVEIIGTIKKMRDRFVDNARACRAFVDVCAEFLMNNCFEKHFPCNAEKYALLRHCEQIFDIKLDFKFFTLENGTGKLDRRIRTIRTTDYKKGGIIQRKRKPLRRSSTSTVNQTADGHKLEEISTDNGTKPVKFAKQGGNKLRVGQKRGLVPERRTWTRPSGDYRVKAESSSNPASMSTRSMAKRIRLAPVVDKKLIILTKRVAPLTAPTTRANVDEKETQDEEIVRELDEEIVMIHEDNLDDVELPVDE